MEATIGGPLKAIANTDFVAGIQKAEYQYENTYDKQSEVGNVGGSSGNSDGSQETTLLYSSNLKHRLWMVKVKYLLL